VIPEESAAEAVDAVWRCRDAVMVRDFEAIEHCFGPNVRVVTAASGTLEGRAAVRGLFEDILRPYETFVIEDGSEARSIGNGVVLAAFVISGRMLGSVRELRSPLSSVSVVADGLIEWHAHYTDPEEAGAAAQRLAEERG
jgi:ketosteroid isomerase-like protein